MINLTLDSAAWAWPQWVILVVLGMNIALVGLLHGEPRTSRAYNFWTDGAARVAVWFVILAAGGFFR